MISARTTDLFLSLTPERVLDAVEAAGLDCSPGCHPLNSFENRVYDVALVDGTRIVAKFYRPERWSEAAILEEHGFMAELAEEGVPICGIRSFPDGSTLKRIDGIAYCLYDRAGGRAPDELADDDLEGLGRIAAWIHNVGAQHAAPARPVMGATTYIRDNVAWLEAQGILPACVADRYNTAAHALADLVDERMAGVPVHRIHGDLHLGNLLVREGRFQVLDFDDMAMGPAVQDLWLMVPGRDAHALAQREAFLEGYEQLRGFDRSTLNLVEPLRGLRMVHYAAWLTRRWHDPIFPATWPHFGTEDEWIRQTEDLEEVVAFARTQDDPDAPVVATETTNADLFWDWEETVPTDR